MLVGKLAVEEIDLARLSAADVIKEIFDSTLREIVDEVNVPMESLSDLVLIGVARNTTSAGRPSSEYYVKYDIPNLLGQYTFSGWIISAGHFDRKSDWKSVMTRENLGDSQSQISSKMICTD